MGRTKRVSDEEFVRIWRAAESLQEVLDKTGLGRSFASALARNYRKAGIPLKRFPRGPRHDSHSDDTNGAFVRIWSAAESLQDVTEKTELTHSAASQKATKFRKAGIPLKRFPRGGDRVSRVSREEFVRIWNMAEFLREVAEKTGLTARSAATTASLLRRAGKSLKYFNRGQPDTVSPEDFVRIWNMAESLREVAEKSGATARHVSERARKLRKGGISLKRFRAGFEAKVSQNDFVRIWNMAESLREVEEKSGLTYHAAAMKAMRLRRAGKPLKDFQGGRPGLRSTRSTTP